MVSTVFESSSLSVVCLRFEKKRKGLFLSLFFATNEYCPFAFGITPLFSLAHKQKSAIQDPETTTAQRGGRRGREHRHPNIPPSRPRAMSSIIVFSVARALFFSRLASLREQSIQTKDDKSGTHKASSFPKVREPQKRVLRRPKTKRKRKKERKKEASSSRSCWSLLLLLTMTTTKKARVSRSREVFVF
tara:strand:- start:144 stop:710 length:567 start_codon:yes stop_codon:yes gene_type:complete